MAELVFLHGAGDSSAVWAAQAEHFQASHRVLGLDLPGHGERLAERAFEDHDANANEITRLIHARGCSKPVVIGHSMGGAVVLSLALREPRLPRALVLVASGARLRMHPRLLESARERAQAAAGDEIVGSLVPLEMVVSPQASAGTRARVSMVVGQSAAQATYADFLANDRFDVMERLQEIKAPTLVLGGEDDQMAPPKHQQFLADRLPAATLVLLPAAGHYPHVEQEAAFNRELERFLSNLTPPPQPLPQHWAQYWGGARGEGLVARGEGEDDGATETGGPRGHQRD